MLRITRQSSHDGETLKLEGKLLAPWIDEVRRACAEAHVAPARIALDLAGVTFVDAAAVAFLTELVKQGHSICAASRFVSELLQMEKKP